jgi:cell division protein FtsZ
MKEKFTIKRTKIRVIGIGGGGGSIISELVKRVKRANFVAANTDVQALKKLPPSIKRFKFGQDLTYGLGTGMDPEKGKLAAERENQKIKRILKDQDLCIFIACLGGGTGSGATSIFTNTSNELGNINIGIFTMPFRFEGERRIKIARDSLEKIKPHLNGFLVIQNQRIFRIINKKASLNQAFSALNKILADNLASFIELIYKPGLINIDFADFKTVLEGKGERIYFNTAEAKGPNRTEEVIKKILNSPLFDFNIKTAKRILFNISGSSDLKMREVEQICNTFSDLNRQSKIIFGVSPNPSKKNSGIKVTLLVTGDRKKKKPVKVEKSSKAKKVPKTEKSSKVKKAKSKPKAKPKKKSIKIKVVSKKRKKKKKKKRLSALEIKKAAQQEEQRRLAEEEKWDIPAFLRRSPQKEEGRTFQGKKKKHD